jgi:hypothetical protein
MADSASGWELRVSVLTAVGFGSVTLTDTARSGLSFSKDFLADEACEAPIFSVRVSVY